MEALIDNYTTTNLSTIRAYSTATHRGGKGLIDISAGVMIHVNIASIILSHQDVYSLNSRIDKLLDEYGRLKNNWDEDDALAPSLHVINQAKYLSRVLENHGQAIFHTAPGPNGEIMLDLRNKRGTRSMEIIFYHNRSVVVFFPDKEKPNQDQFTSGKLSNYLEWLNENSVSWEDANL